MRVLDWTLPEQRATLRMQVAAVLRDHGLLAFPTGSSYGLGVDPSDLEAVERLLRLKKRRPGNPVPLIASDATIAAGLAKSLPPAFSELAGAFWPGPLSLVLPAREGLAGGITAGTGTVAVRVPGNQVARQVAQAAGGVLTATSANRGGATPCTDPQQLVELLLGQPALLVADGMAAGADRSTLLDIRSLPARILRPGRVGRQALAAVLGPADLAPE